MGTVEDNVAASCQGYSMGNAEYVHEVSRARGI